MRSYTLVLVIIILTNVSFAQDGWKELQPELTKRELFQISFTDTLTGYFLGDSVIIKTKDGGDNWEKLSAPESYPYINFFTDENIIWLSSGEGKIFNSSDGGTTWQEIYSSEKIIRNIYFHDYNNGWAIGDYKFIMHTSNGGENWEVQYTYEYDSLLTLSFINNQNGWCGKDLKTTNGGLNWVRFSTNLSYHPKQIKYLNNQYGISLSGTQGYKVLFKTTNGGTDWDTLYAPSSSINIISLEIKDSINLYILVKHEYPGTSIRKSSDGGYNWASVYSLEHQEMYAHIKSIAVLSDSTIFCNVWGYTGSYIFRKKTGDHNFLMSNRVNGHWLRDIHAFNKDTIITGGGERWSHYGEIFKTYDRGKTWHKKHIPLGYGISRLLFINDKGFAICDTVYPSGSWISKLLGTTDAGESWYINYENPSGLTLTDIYFLNELRGFISASGGKILKTTDRGNSWSEIIIAGPGTDFNGIFFHGNTGWVAGTPSFKTTDGGNSWFPVAVIPNYGDAFYFKNDLEGNAVTSNTSDGGNSWHGNLQNWYGNDYFPSMAYDQGMLYLTADTHNTDFSYGALFKSSDFGVSWDTLIHYIAHKPLQSVEVHNGIGWACGFHGLILYKDSVTITTSDEIESKEEPGVYTLNPNYPNPFNPSTKISYTLKDEGNVKLNIYDIKGELISTLVDEKQQAGSYEVDFTLPGNISTGVYIYRLTVSDNSSHNVIFSDVKKMVYLK